MNSRWMRNGFIYLLIVVAVIAILFTLFSDVSGSREVPIDEVISMAKRGQIETIEVHGDQRQRVILVDYHIEAVG